MLPALRSGRKTRRNASKGEGPPAGGRSGRKKNCHPWQFFFPTAGVLPAYPPPTRHGAGRTSPPRRVVFHRCLRAPRPRQSAAFSVSTQLVEPLPQGKRAPFPRRAGLPCGKTGSPRCAQSNSPPRCRHPCREAAPCPSSATLYPAAPDSPAGRPAPPPDAPTASPFFSGFPRPYCPPNTWRAKRLHSQPPQRPFERQKQNASRAS